MHAVVEAGSEFAMENPVDQGDLSQPELLIYPNHAPIWLMPDILALRDHASCLLVTLPMLAFGVNYEKPTIVMCAPNLARHLKDLRNLQCDAKPTGSSGGREVNGIWNSAADVAYPTELNLWIAQAIAQLATTHRGIGLHSPVSKLMEGLYNILHEASSNNSSNPTPVPSRKGYPHSSSTLPTGYSDAIPMPAPIGPLANDSSPQLPLPKGKPWWFTESANVPSAHTRLLQGSKGTSLFASALLCVREGFKAVCNAFVIQSDKSAIEDSKDHGEAINDNSKGWLRTEQVELKYHRNNGSFTLMDLDVFPPGRRFVKLIWIYKRKLETAFQSVPMYAKLLATARRHLRLISIARHDVYRTHCAARHSTSLRVFSAPVGNHELLIRRWCLVSCRLCAVRPQTHRSRAKPSATWTSSLLGITRGTSNARGSILSSKQ